MSDVRPTIAFLSPIEPAMTGNGLAMRMGQFADALAAFADVHVIVISAAGRLAGVARVKTPNITIHEIETSRRTDTQFNLLSRIADDDARLAAFRAYGKPSLARFVSASVLGDLAILLKRLRPDAVIIGRSYLLPCMEALPDAPVIVDLDEDDFAALTDRAHAAAREGRMHEAAWLAQEGAACDALIRQYTRRLRAAFFSSDPERLALAQRFPGFSVELAVNAIRVPPFFAKREEPGLLLFVGSLGYGPNVEGLSWFVDKVSPRLRVHEARVVVVGGGLPADSRLRTSSLELVGQAPLLGPFYARASLVIAPLHSGGGTRIKLLEAAAHRTAAVATSKAGEGLDWSAGWRADSPADFADACRVALFDREERAKRAAAGLEWVRCRHARDKVVAHMAVRLRELLS